MTGLLRGKLKAFLIIGMMFALMAAVACEGSRGPQGDTGAPGAPGNPGAPGAAGNPGEPGSSGDDGDDGDAGNDGDDGDAGDAGDDGDDGDDGDAGDAGAPGNPGNPGATGAAGKDGADGADGADGSDGTTQIAGIIVFDASGPSTGAAELTGGTATITIIGGGFAEGEQISVSAKRGGFDLILSSSTSRTNDSLTVGNENGAFTLTVELGAIWSEGLYTITATGDQGNRGATAFLLVDKVTG